MVNETSSFPSKQFSTSFEEEVRNVVSLFNQAKIEFQTQKIEKEALKLWKITETYSKTLKFNNINLALLEELVVKEQVRVQIIELQKRLL